MLVAEPTPRNDAGWASAMVHRDISDDPLMAARHRAFISLHLVSGLVALALVPVVLALGAPANVATLFVMAILIIPVAIALFVSRTGKLALGHALSATILAATATGFALLTGGLASPLLIWLLIPPIEASLSGDRRMVIAAGVASVVGAGVLVMVEVLGQIPTPRVLPGPEWLLAAVSIVVALTYAVSIALRLRNLHGFLAEAALSEHKRYELMAENASDMILCQNRNGDVTFASGGVERVLGLSSEGLVGNGLMSCIIVSDRPAFLAALDAAIQGDRPQCVELRVQRVGAASGQGSVWIELRCRKIKGHDSVVSVVRDISQQKAQAMAVERARSEAEQASIAKTRFLASVSHELRTPLNAVIGFSEILSQELFGRLENEKQREYVGLIHDSGSHLLSVVNDILDMSKIETGRFEIIREPFDLASLVEQTVRILAGELDKKSMTIALDLPRNLPEFNADARACRQIVLNLVSNAIKFSHEGGHIVVGVVDIGTGVELYVADNGIGIPADDIPRLGQPFVQVHSSYDKTYEGTGLGLSMVSGLAKLHGGEMSIASELGNGTRVTVTLPESEAAACDKERLTEDDCGQETVLARPSFRNEDVSIAEPALPRRMVS
ncbi:MAG: ATP-binding protein [Pseudomonadota bacterium]